MSENEALLLVNKGKVTRANRVRSRIRGIIEGADEVLEVDSRNNPTHELEGVLFARSLRLPGATTKEVQRVAGPWLKRLAAMRNVAGQLYAGESVLLKTAEEGDYQVAGGVSKGELLATNSHLLIRELDTNEELRISQRRGWEGGLFWGPVTKTTFEAGGRKYTVRSQRDGAEQVVVGFKSSKKGKSRTS